MKLDVECMRYLTKDEYRVLTAVEMGMRNHELVPLELITTIAKLRHGGSSKIMSNLLRYKLVAHEQQNYNGYRLSYLGYDILALRTLLSRGKVVSVGRQIGVGKESDIFEALDEHGEEVVIKIHRLGRTSFRAVRRHRDYLENKSKASWLYMSRLAAIKEFAFMQVLFENGFPTPTPLDQNRHVVVMSRVAGFPMAQIKAGKMEGAEQVFRTCTDILKRLAQFGLVHCDFNEFNLMINGETSQVTLIDFPQMVSTGHPNASELFSRDMNCLIKFFGMKMHFCPPDDAVLKLEDIVSEVDAYASAMSSKSISAQDDSMLLDFIGESTAETEAEIEETAEGGIEGKVSSADPIVATVTPDLLPGIASDAPVQAVAAAAAVDGEMTSSDEDEGDEGEALESVASTADVNMAIRERVQR
jgi:RIO kinase 2